MNTDIAVIGAGAFGTALASVVARRGDPVFLLGRDAGTMEEIQKSRLHAQKLPESKLPEPLQATVDRNCLAGVRTVLLAVPAQHLREAVRTYREAIAPKADLVVCAKGIEQATGLFLADVVHAELGNRTVALLSGPGFAADIVRGLPTAMTLASEDDDAAERIAARLSGNAFRLYASTDVTGVEIGGSLKNVLAIACGIVEGRGLGESARAALIARGLAELGRFSAAFGGRPETVAGLSGLGDLVLTATSHQSRNLRFGLALGQGTAASELMAPGAPLSEGAFTATIAAQLSREKDMDVPITMAVARILEGAISVEEAIDDLMNRPLTRE